MLAGPPTSRLVRPWVYSWYTTLESKAVWRFVLVTRPMFMIGGKPSDRRAHVRRAADRSGVRASVDAVEPDAAKAELVLLEVAIRLAEAEHIEVVVHVVAQVGDVQDLLVVAGGVRRVERHDAVDDGPLHRRPRHSEVAVGGVADSAIDVHPVAREARGQACGNRQRVHVQRQREVEHLARAAPVHLVDVAARLHAGRELVRVQHVAVGGVDENTPLLGRRQRQHDLPCQAQLVVERQPRQRCDHGLLERSALEDRAAFGVVLL